MPNYYDSNGELALSTTFTDAQGRHYIAGVEVHDFVWSEYIEEVAG